MNPALDLQQLEACRFLDDGERLERNSDYLLWQKSKVTKRMEQVKAIEKSNQHAKLCKQLISRSIWAHFQ
jgi:hypothetical protein